MSSGTGISLIVGLGNPGSEYELTRHNAGAWFVENIARSLNVQLRSNAKCKGMHAIASIEGHDCHLLIPSTFMNLSGQSIHALAQFYKIPTTSILIAHDEIDLPTGIIRLKYDGGHGGHNGLRDTISHLNSNTFYRLRIGVGRPQHSKDVIDYVLKKPSKSERELIDTALQKAEPLLPLLVEGHFQKAMQQLHSD